MGGEDWKIIAGILGMAAVFFLLSAFLTEYPGQGLTGEQDHVSTPGEDIEDRAGEPKIFYHYEGPQPEDGDTFGGNGENEEPEEIFVLKTGDKLDLGNDYTLKIKQIDSEGKKVWLEIERREKFIDDKIIHVSGSWEVQPEGKNGRIIEIYTTEILESELELEVRQRP